MMQFAQVVINLFFDSNILESKDLENKQYVNSLKFMQLFSGLGIFIIPMFLYSYLVTFDFKFRKVIRQNVMLIITIMLIITPFVAMITQLNLSIKTPNWANQIDAQTNLTIIALLKMDSIIDLVFNLLVIAIIPAIGEEIFFRGYLQQKLIKWIRSPHIGIIITAILFSIIHFQFSGLIPRFILGVLLGYIFYWSSSLWIPIIAHFVNNAQVLIISYVYKDINNSMLSTNIDVASGLFSFFGASLLLYIFYKNSNLKNKRIQ
tara:strand:- start:2241 stop:3026 length:786 start_codon:yes stop_codon:yes gene_type:complete